MNEIRWDKVRSADDSRVPTIRGFLRDADGEYPIATVRLDRIHHGAQVVDDNGNRFRVMGYGAVQGSVVVRDRYRTMYQADSGIHVYPVDHRQVIR